MQQFIFVFLWKKKSAQTITLPKLLFPCQFFVCGLNYNALDDQKMTVVMKNGHKDEMK